MLARQTRLMRRPSRQEVSQLQGSLLEWFARHERKFPWRRPNATHYLSVLSEVLLQRTRAEVVAGFLPAFIRRYPSWRKLSQATEGDLEQWLRPLGLWRRRAISLLALARALRARGGRLPRLREEVDTLPGVGQYIANAIFLFTSKHPEPLLDVNMARVLERCFGRRKLADIRYDPRLQEVARLVVNGADPARLNWAILDLAAMACSRNDPRCESCPLLGMCAEGRRRNVNQFQLREVTRRQPRRNKRIVHGQR
jgi:A/G-specific adenine glycosylase